MLSPQLKKACGTNKTITKTNITKFQIAKLRAFGFSLEIIIPEAIIEITMNGCVNRFAMIWAKYVSLKPEESVLTEIRNLDWKK